jgi:hypothetical protein
MWQMGELERNFMTMQTSSGEELNIMGDRCIAELSEKKKDQGQDIFVTPFTIDIPSFARDFFSMWEKISQYYFHL